MSHFPQRRLQPSYNSDGKLLFPAKRKETGYKLRKLVDHTCSVRRDSQKSHTLGPLKQPFNPAEPAQNVSYSVRTSQ